MSFHRAPALAGLMLLAFAAFGQVAPGSVSTVPAGATAPPLTGQLRWKIYVHDTLFSPAAVVRTAGAAVGSQVTKNPDEWPRNARGYGLRAADTFGRFTLEDTYRATSAALLGHEVRYMRSMDRGFFPRVGHAVAAAFVTTDRNGRRVPDVSQIGAAYGSEFTALLWRPDGSAHASDALQRGSIQVGFNAGVNLIREFTPEFKRMFRK